MRRRETNDKVSSPFDTVLAGVKEGELRLARTPADLRESERILKESLALQDSKEIVYSKQREGRDYRNLRTLVLTSGNVVVSVASVGCHRYNDEMVVEIMALATSRAHRRKGHGRRIVGVFSEFS